MNRDPPRSPRTFVDYGYSSSYRPDRTRLTRGNERTIVTTIYNRIAVDCAAVSIKHVVLDDAGRYKETVDSGLNSCLTLSANKDQTGRSFIQDSVLSMLDEGCIAIVPVDTDKDIRKVDSYDVLSLRVGKVVEWHPDFVKIRLYNDRNGQSDEVMLPKRSVSIIENPFYSVMNEPNSVLQRLIRKLSLLDAIDEQSGAGKLDLIIQLPYTIKTQARRDQAELRKKDIEMQLAGSKYGIAYIDSTEHITQLNRSVDNNLLSQIEYLTTTLYSQLGITTSILDGTADDKTMLNYENHIIVPILSALVDEMNRKFLTEKDRKKKHEAIMYFRDPFKLVPIGSLADIADKFTRNEIMSSNEIRQIAGLPPVDSELANQLRNKNLNVTEGQTFASTTGEDSSAVPASPEMNAEVIPQQSTENLETKANSLTDDQLSEALEQAFPGTSIDELTDDQIAQAIQNYNSSGAVEQTEPEENLDAKAQSLTDEQLAEAIEQAYPGANIDELTDEQIADAIKRYNPSNVPPT